MSRDLTSAAQAEAEAQFHTLILLAKLDFSDGGVFVHSGIGDILYDGETYTGVGDLGAISEARETESTRPSSLDLKLNAQVSTYLADALDAGKYGDPITIYAAYRGSDGVIISDPWVVWSGWFEFATITAGLENSITITAQHDLSVLDEKSGERFTNENQLRRFAGDVGMEFVHQSATSRLVWGNTGMTTRGTDDRPNLGPDEHLP